MQLKKTNILIPALIGLSVSLTFLYVQLNLFDVVVWNYNVCHMLFGFTFPFFLSYLAIPPGKVEQIRLREVFNRIMSVPAHAWPLAGVRTMWRSIVRDFKEGLPWSPLMGVAFTLFFALGNEVIVDPATNGIPFTSAYGNFVADVCGMMLFLLITYPFVKHSMRFERA
ncbi:MULTISPECIES: hypothetical protein [Pseudomonas]|uniref:VanZ-like domain-containing protein n=1 Tax=Pseudomonas fluorescens TaxID=294 RepID=A0A7M2IYN3_PSEFL|nr:MULTISPECIES: hypothetical protein [Pseudomonas]PMX29534.1 hypothetical protein C1Y23_00705 [Pseudomonas sp. GW460-12]PMX38096.1 hypothetical protein C1Y24_00780 [Pseudomonas sp. MPR-R2A4]PMX43849.1 hypothetical protein C1Y26_01120 [Pseudomonas sp. MPR-R2A7]PMX55934.1 hypothetical protein C1Y17_00705 [Pseudomonas sp. MPR-R2A6]PMX93934.1 hypothetical protein C1Y21_01120 [Pseudomonas sp. MPR-R2A3]